MAAAFQADIGVIALEDAGIYPWLGALDREKRVVVETSLPPVRWSTIGYSVAAVNEVIAELLSAREWRSVRAVGFSAFGQIDRRKKLLMAVPREEWEGEDEKFPISFDGLVRKTLGAKVPIIVEHDVTACARAEWTKGGHHRPAHREHDTSLFGYVRVGTGVGVEILRDGWVLHQNRRGESGHIPICVDPRDKLVKSTCRQHAQCLEGYVSAMAIARRNGMSEQDKIDLLGIYIGQLIASLTMFTMPYTVVLGGTTMLTSHGVPNYELYEKVRRGCWTWLGNYPAYGHQDDLGKYIRQASMRVEHAAITGAASLALMEIKE